MKISFDPKADIIRIKFQDGTYDISKELEDGIILDMTKDKKLMAIEILDITERIPGKSLKEITTVISG